MMIILIFKILFFFTNCSGVDQSHKMHSIKKYLQSTIKKKIKYSCIDKDQILVSGYLGELNKKRYNLPNVENIILKFYEDLKYIHHIEFYHHYKINHNSTFIATKEFEWYDKFDRETKNNFHYPAKIIKYLSLPKEFESLSKEQRTNLKIITSYFVLLHVGKEKKLMDMLGKILHKKISFDEFKLILEEAKNVEVEPSELLKSDVYYEGNETFVRIYARILPIKELKFYYEYLVKNNYTQHKLSNFIFNIASRKDIEKIKMFYPEKRNKSESYIGNRIYTEHLQNLESQKNYEDQKLKKKLLYEAFKTIFACIVFHIGLKILSIVTNSMKLQ